MDALSLRLADATLALCRIASPIGHEAELADHVGRWAALAGRFPDRERLRVSHSWVLGDLADPRPAVALVGHLDTVPAHPRDRAPCIEGDRVFGLGASDMKGGLAVMMTLAEELDRAALPVNVLWVLYEREEGPYLESGLGPLFDAAPALRHVRLGIAMEPTDNVVQVGCVGSLHATLRFTGKSAHSARPWQGENAVHKAGPLLTELLEARPVPVEQSGFTFQEVMTVTRAAGGRARNVVPDHFELNLNYRFAPGKSTARAEQDLRDWVRGRAQVELHDVAPSGRVCADNPLYRRLLEVTGLPAAAKQAWTDVARLSEWGVDAVNFGPGETSQAHQENESAPIPALAQAYRKLQAFLVAA